MTMDAAHSKTAIATPFLVCIASPLIGVRPLESVRVKGSDPFSFLLDRDRLEPCGRVGQRRRAGGDVVHTQKIGNQIGVRSRLKLPRLSAGIERLRRSKSSLRFF